MSFRIRVKLIGTVEVIVLLGLGMKYMLLPNLFLQC